MRLSALKRLPCLHYYLERSFDDLTRTCEQSTCAGAQRQFVVTAAQELLRASHIFLSSLESMTRSAWMKGCRPFQSSSSVTKGRNRMYATAHLACAGKGIPADTSRARRLRPERGCR